jgi:hypothetical protein
MNLISRQDAKTQGAVRYFSGRTCSKGHVAQRYTSCYSCVVCRAEAERAWWLAHPKQRRDKAKRIYRKNPGRSERVKASAEVIRTLKAQPCADCKNSFHPACMQFDHVRGVKKYNVSNMHGYGWESILAEIAKCELVCANCHALRTYNRKERV